jgi:hypothetical protein
MRTLLVAVLLISAVGGCSTREVSVGDAAPSDAPSPRDAGCDAVISLDFPCLHRSVCASLTAIKACHNVDCLEYTGTYACCDGAQCWDGTVTECPTGTVCFMPAPPTLPEAKCLPPRDAGADADYRGLFEPDGGYSCW